MSGFVADASVTLAWCFADESTHFTKHLLDRLFAGEPVAVPACWPTEVLNGLLRAKRRGRVTESEIQFFLANLRLIDVRIDRWSGWPFLDTIQSLAEHHSLTAYDAAYLELAIRSGWPLATLDGALLRAATTENVALP
jgi:predicted nucleic acid-binding protein